MAQLTPALDFSQVTKTYPAIPPVHALNEVTVSVHTGEIFGIVGESGAGKTTFLHLSLGLIAPTSGSIRVLGTSLEQLTPAQLRSLRGHIGVVFQGHHLLHNLTALDNVELPARLSGAHDRERARDLLDFVGLSDRASNYPAQLSGGQQQRVAIARALMTAPQLMLFDEPTSALDQGTRQSMLDLIWHTREEFGTTCVIVSHDLDAVKAVCGRAALFESGRVRDTVSVTPPSTNATLPYLEQARKQLES